MRIDSLAQLGAVLRETRVAQKIPLQDLAQVLNTSHTLLRRQEHGEPTRALQILLETMKQLGIEMHVEVPPNVHLDPDKLAAGLTHFSRARP
jgi:transcriptional regulator with XRE-family HTH domain